MHSHYEESSFEHIRHKFLVVNLLLIENFLQALERVWFPDFILNFRGAEFTLINLFLVLVTAVEDTSKLIHVVVFVSFTDLSTSKNGFDKVQAAVLHLCMESHPHLVPWQKSHTVCVIRPFKSSFLTRLLWSSKPADSNDIADRNVGQDCRVYIHIKQKVGVVSDLEFSFALLWSICCHVFNLHNDIKLTLIAWLCFRIVQNGLFDLVQVMVENLVVNKI